MTSSHLLRLVSTVDYLNFDAVALNTDEESFRLFSFFESYFSNYIEGTEFEIEEAKAIVDSGIPMPRRDEDSHDILGTFKVLSNRAEMMRTPTSPKELFAILSHRHTILLEGRPHMNPGVFKMKNNRAGQTEFVDHQLVKGTLSQGFKYYAALTDPFARAIFMMFMISEVHPFNDGNGRIARVMMNAELVRADHPVSLYQQCSARIISWHCASSPATKTRWHTST